MSTQPDPVREETGGDGWVCPGCGTEYVRDIGRCGQLKPWDCRERVVPLAVMRAARALADASDDGCFEELDAARAGRELSGEENFAEEAGSGADDRAYYCKLAAAALAAAPSVSQQETGGQALRDALEQARVRLEQCHRDRTERDKVMATAQTGIGEIDRALVPAAPPSASDGDAEARLRKIWKLAARMWDASHQEEWGDVLTIADGGEWTDEDAPASDGEGLRELAAALADALDDVLRYARPAQIGGTYYDLQKPSQASMDRYRALVARVRELPAGETRRCVWPATVSTSTMRLEAGELYRFVHALAPGEGARS